jgi:release factor glutamine methyltransferase
MSDDARRRAGEQRVREDGDALAAALAIPANEARREVRLLLAHALGVDGARILAHPEDAADASASSTYRDLFARRLKGEPVAYITGRREFYGLEFEVSPAVLIPRPETEVVVDLALKHIAMDAPCHVLDLGTGSGCIALTLAKLRPRAQVFAVDASADALAVAGRNVARHGLRNVKLLQGSWFEPVQHRHFDVIVSNPPYVAEGDPHLSQGDLRFEPRAALVGGADGLEAIRLIVAEASVHLNPGGWLILEHGYDQQRALQRVAIDAGFGSLVSHTDLAGIPRALASQLTVRR